MNATSSSLSAMSCFVTAWNLWRNVTTLCRKKTGFLCNCLPCAMRCSSWRPRNKVKKLGVPFCTKSSTMRSMCLRTLASSLRASRILRKLSRRFRTIFRRNQADWALFLRITSLIWMRISTNSSRVKGFSLVPRVELVMRPRTEANT